MDILSTRLMILTSRRRYLAQMPISFIDLTTM